MMNQLQLAFPTRFGGCLRTHSQFLALRGYHFPPLTMRKLFRLFIRLAKWNGRIIKRYVRLVESTRRPVTNGKPGQMTPGIGLEVSLLSVSVALGAGHLVLFFRA
ncbi:MAG: hypothetical protein ABJZ55_11000 [Fuerstiella sp.]